MYMWGRSDSPGYVPHGHIGSPRIHFAAGMPQALAGGPAGSRRRRDRHSPEEQQEHVGRAATARLSPAKAQGRPAAAPTGGRRTLGEAAADQISRGRAYRGTTGLPKREPKTPRSAAAGEASPSEKAWSKKTPVQEKPPHLASQVHPKWRKVGPLSRSLGAKVPAQKNKPTENSVDLYLVAMPRWDYPRFCQRSRRSASRSSLERRGDFPGFAASSLT